ncbi:MAG: shikimate dehydrogenase [Gammaproteobacteria bacterium]|nr:shikimate dehydrogenase [Gammaproteobacteria bacterium]
MTKPDRYAVMGNPVAHSKSPRIHALFAEQTGEPIVYEAILVPVDGFAEAVAEFQRAGGKGLNVTLPFKQEAWALAEERSPRAERARAVNTLVLRPDGTRLGDNTDGAGLIRDLHNHGLRVAGRRILVLGAGGAARGVLGPLLGERPAAVLIANRTAEKAVVLARDFRDLGPIAGGGFDALAGRTYELVINATAASLEGEVPPVPDAALAEGGWVYDMMYADTPTAFVRWGAARGAGRSLDGLGMLVEQAAESFYLWRGVRPDTAPVLEALRGERTA